MNAKRIWSWGLFVLLIFAGSLVSAQEATPDTVSPPNPQISAEIEVGEIELMEITIEAVIEKPRVAILPKRVEPELGEMEFIDRSFEEELKKGLYEIENRNLKEQLELIMGKTKTVDPMIAYDLLAKYRDVWEFVGNVSKSGDSYVITLPKKAAKEHGIQKGRSVMVSLKVLRFKENKPGFTLPPGYS